MRPSFCPIRRGAVFLRGGEPRRADPAHRLRHRRQRRRRRRAAQDFRSSTIASRRWLFNPNTLAPEYPESAITRPFPFNGYYTEDEAPEVDGETYKLEVGGLIDNKEPWTLEQLYALPQVSQITRHVCVEGWSAIGSWQGVRLSRIPQADRRRHPREIRLVPVRRGLFQHHRHADRAASADATSFKFDNQILPRKYGFPMKCRIPTKLGFKNPKYITAMYVQNNDAGGYWENQGYNWFSGL